MFGLQNVHFFEDEDENGLLPVISSTNKTTSNDDDDDWEKVILSDQVQLELDDKDDDDPDESSNEFSTQNLISDDFVRLNYKEALSTLIELQLSTTNDLSASAKEDVPESLSFDNPKESRPEVKPDTIRTNEVEDDPSKSETLSTQVKDTRLYSVNSSSSNQSGLFSLVNQ